MIVVKKDDIAADYDSLRTERLVSLGLGPRVIGLLRKPLPGLVSSLLCFDTLYLAHGTPCNPQTRDAQESSINTVH